MKKRMNASLSCLENWTILISNPTTKVKELRVTSRLFFYKEKIMWKRELIRNKMYALLLIAIGAMPMMIDGDGTVFIFALLLGGALFFSKKNVIRRGCKSGSCKNERMEGTVEKQ